MFWQPRVPKPLTRVENFSKLSHHASSGMNKKQFRLNIASACLYSEWWGHLALSRISGKCNEVSSALKLEKACRIPWKPSPSSSTWRCFSAHVSTCEHTCVGWQHLNVYKPGAGEVVYGLSLRRLLAKDGRPCMWGCTKGCTTVLFARVLFAR